MKALVTGGYGFIGSHLVALLLEKGVDVVVLDDFSSGKEENLKDVLDQIETVTADVRDEAAMVAASKDVDYIFHLAAKVSVQDSFNDPDLVISVNTGGSRNVLQAAVKNGVKRVVISSTCAVYGDQNVISVHEGLSPNPISPYATSKLLAEELAEEFYQEHGQETLCLRYFNVYGPRQRPDSAYAAVIPKFIHLYAQKTPPSIFGSGLQRRDFINVRDIVNANFLAATAPSPQHRVYNIGTGQSTNLLELLKHISAAAGYEVPPSFLEAKEGDILHSQADISRAAKDLNFQPGITLAEGIRAMITPLLVPQA